MSIGREQVRVPVIILATVLYGTPPLPGYLRVTETSAVDLSGCPPGIEWNSLQTGEGGGGNASRVWTPLPQHLSLACGRALWVTLC